jgi:hypothetical protein
VSYFTLVRKFREEGPHSQGDVRFGSLADICSAKGHVRFTPNSDRKSGFPHKVISALPPKADMCGAARQVRFGPIADMARYSIISSTRACIAAGTLRSRGELCVRSDVDLEGGKVILLHHLGADSVRRCYVTSRFQQRSRN